MKKPYYILAFLLKKSMLLVILCVCCLKKDYANLLLIYATHKDLWPESLALMVHIEDDLKREMGDIAAAEHEVVLDDLIQTVHRLSLWQDALPLFTCMSANTQYKVINVPSMQQHDVLQASGITYGKI
jgi:hypothetical protein